MLVKNFITGAVVIGSVFLTGCGTNNAKTNEPTEQVEVQNNIIEQADILPDELSARIMGVKNGMLGNMSTSLTVGQALDGWRECSNPQWEEKDGERGEQMVSFKCDYNDLQGFLKTTEPDIAEKVKSVQVAVLFTLTADQTQFSPTSAAYIFTFNDDKQFILERNWVFILQAIYQNGKEYNSVSQSDYDARQ